MQRELLSPLASRVMELPTVELYKRLASMHGSTHCGVGLTPYVVTKVKLSIS